MANYLVTDTELTQVANAIRAKSRTHGQLAFPAGFVNTIAGITPQLSRGSGSDDYSVQESWIEEEGDYYYWIPLPVSVSRWYDPPYKADLLYGDNVQEADIPVIFDGSKWYCVLAGYNDAASRFQYNKIRVHYIHFSAVI